ncbi:MAG: hypothetical protein WBO34_01125, partial [Gammaproteobacteria bacterium]
GKDMPNLITTMWGIWVVVAAVNFFGHYQSQQVRRAEQLTDPYTVSGQEQRLPSWEYAEDEPGKPSAILTLQASYAKVYRQLDVELARRVTTVQIPPLFAPEFLEDKLRFPAAIGQLEDYGQVF